MTDKQLAYQRTTQRERILAERRHGDDTEVAYRTGYVQQFVQMVVNGQRENDTVLQFYIKYLDDRRNDRMLSGLIKQPKRKAKRVAEEQEGGQAA